MLRGLAHVYIYITKILVPSSTPLAILTYSESEGRNLHQNISFT